MSAREIATALLFILIAMILGAWDQAVWNWNHATADTQIRFAAIAITVTALILIHLFGGGIVQFLT